MDIQFEEHKDLTSLTTFGIPAKARWYAEYTSEAELLKISRSEIFINNEILNLGGGSNLLFIDEFEGLVLHSRIGGIVRLLEGPRSVSQRAIQKQVPRGEGDVRPQPRSPGLGRQGDTAQRQHHHEHDCCLSHNRVFLG